MPSLGLAIFLDLAARQSLEHDPKRGPLSLTRALGGDRPTVSFDDAPADRQPESQASESASDGGLPLLEWVEDRRQDVRFDPDPGVGNLHDETILLLPLIPRAD